MLDQKAERKLLRARLITLAGPIIVQNVLSSAVSSMDVIMLNFVGQDAIAAVSLAAQIANILFMVLYGAGTGATMMIAQYYGKGDTDAIHVIQGIAMRFSFATAVIFAGAAVLIPKQLMLIFTNDPSLIQLGADYLRVVSIAYLCWGITEVYLSVLRSVGMVKTSMNLNILAFALNIVLNAVFIFGWLGMPKMGIAGVALATSLSRLVELAACFVVSSRIDYKLKLSYMFIDNKLLLKDFLNMALPAMLNDIVWGLAFSVYSVILGHLGSDAVAANSLGSVVRNFASVAGFGMSSACGILLGQVIGEGDNDRARLAASESLRLTVAGSAIGMVGILIATPFVLMAADLTPTALGYLKWMLLINSVYLYGGTINTTLIAGVFRAGGDTKFGLKVDFIDMWLYAVPLGLFVAFVLKLPVMGVYLCMCTDEFVKWPWVFKRYFSGKWLNNITRDDWK